MNAEKSLHLSIIGDDLKTISQTVEVLRKAGFRARPALTIDEISAAAEQNSPVLIVGNFTRDKSKSAEAFRSIKQHKKLRTVPLILIDSENSQTNSNEYFIIPDEPLVLAATAAKLIERAECESRLNKSEQRFKNLFESEMMGIFFWEKNGRISNANNAFLKMVGYQKSDLKSGRLNWISLTPEKYLQNDFEVLEVIDEIRVCQPLEKEFIRRDGSFVPVLIGGALLEGETDFGVSFIINIEEQKAAEDKFLNEQNFNAQAVDSLPGVFYIIDADGKLLRWNKTLEWVTEYTAAEISKMSAVNFVGDDEISVVRQKIEQGLTAGETAVEINIVSKSGKKIAYFFTGKRIILNQKPCLVGMGLDISERKQIEDKLQKSQERLTLAQQATGIGTFEWNIQTNSVIWTKELEELFGFPSGSFGETYEDWAKSVYPDDLPDVEKAARESIVSGDFVKEYRIVLPDKKIRWMHARGKIFYDSQQSPLKMIGVNIDITESKEVEERLRYKREKLQALNDRLQSIREEERTRIAREVHDSLGQSLTAIKLDVSWLRKNLREMKPAFLRNSLTERIQLLLALIDDSVAAVQDISAKLRPGLLDTMGLAAAIEWEVQQFERRTEIACFCSMPNKTLKLDAEKSTAIFRILQELLTNVSRHANATKVWISLQKNRHEIVFIISDNGRGIENHQITGANSLGLLGISERTRLWGGSFEIAGKKDEGTIVKIRMPATKPKEIFDVDEIENTFA